MILTQGQEPKAKLEATTNFNIKTFKGKQGGDSKAAKV